MKDKILLRQGLEILAVSHGVMSYKYIWNKAGYQAVWNFNFLGYSYNMDWNGFIFLKIACDFLTSGHIEAV